jgi:hypothetical protein
LPCKHEWDDDDDENVETVFISQDTWLYTSLTTPLLTFVTNVVSAVEGGRTFSYSLLLGSDIMLNQHHRRDWVQITGTCDCSGCDSALSPELVDVSTGLKEQDVFSVLFTLPAIPSNVSLGAVELICDYEYTNLYPQVMFFLICMGDQSALSCQIINGACRNRAVVNVTHFVLFSLDDHRASVAFEVSLVRGILNRHTVFLFTHHHFKKEPRCEFQDAFSEVVVAFAEMAAGGSSEDEAVVSLWNADEQGKLLFSALDLFRASNDPCCREVR